MTLDDAIARIEKERDQHAWWVGFWEQMELGEYDGEKYGWMIEAAARKRDEWTAVLAAVRDKMEEGVW